MNHHLPDGGLAVDSSRQAAYPEVTGYTIPTLLDCGEREHANRLGEWLISIQRSDGGFAGPDGLDQSYLFDTAQAARGLLALIGRVDGAEEALRRAVEWIVRSTDDQGIVRPRPDSVWSKTYGDHISEDIHLYALPPILEAGRRLGIPEYVDCVERTVTYYTQKPDLLRFRFLTHFYGYVLEALVDLGRSDLARQGLGDILSCQGADGSIPGIPGARWICSPGTAQLAIVGYKLGLLDFANSALRYLQGLQTPSGGFLGSYGSGATYAPRTELSWACKYFLDACHWRMRTSLSSHPERIQAESAAADYSLPVILASVKNVDAERVLEVGGGHGRYLRALQSSFPGADLWSVDVSEEHLESFPSSINVRSASALNLPFDDASFDIVVCTQVLEYTIRMERTIDEICRVLKPNGKLIFTARSAARNDRFRIEGWEEWFELDQITDVLEQWCESVTWESLPAPLPHAEDSRLVVWTGYRATVRKVDRHQTPPRHLDPVPLPQSLRNYCRARRQAQAYGLIESGFRCYGEGKIARARQDFIGAIRLDPYWIRNRGVLSILARSLVPRRGGRESESANWSR